MSAFDQAFEIVVGHEGGYSNNSADPGGETKYGISKRSYPSVNIGALTLDQAKAIYQADYWNRAGCDLCDPGLALIVFDAAVNNGVGQAIRWLQAAVGVKADGVIGPATRAAIAKADAQDALVAAHSARIHMMAGLSTWATFGRGWSKRLAQLPYQAAKMTGNDAPAASSSV
ncbi:MAG TPA: glycosyl hydrolase 108 family protein, partial [Stellaceae bacterium]